MSRTHTHTAAQQRQGAPACRQSANVGPPAERHQSASVVPLLRRCKQDSSGCACLAWYTALWVCSVTYRRCFATNAPHCGHEQTCPPTADVTQPLHHQSCSKHRLSRGAAKKCCRLHNDLSPACWSSRWQIVQGSNPITAEGSTLRSLVFAGRAGVHCTMSVRVTYECTHWHLLLQLHCQPTRSWLRRTSQGKALGNQIR